MTSKLLVPLGGLIVIAGVWFWQDGGQPAESVVPPAPTPPPEMTTDGRALPYRGLAIQVASGYQPLETYGPLLDEVAALGANTALLSVAGYMEHAQTQSIYIDARKVPARADLRALIARARDNGLHVFLMPIVLLENPRGNDWRGVIDPPSWDIWWEEYRAFVLYFADIAREAGAHGLIVGSELISTEKQTERWVRLIDEIRPRFYGGVLGYSANWDHYRPVQFWDHLDFVGMTSYYKLADGPLPTVAEIVERWQPIKRDILAWQRRIERPILFTEVGWCSQAGAATAPWNYYQDQNATPGALEEQRRLYEAFIRVWDDTPEIMGAIWWEWDNSPGGPGDYGYTPKRKPAEALLRQWFAAGQGQAATTAPSTRPAASPEQVIRND
jgi:hypothetical protein